MRMRKFLVLGLIALVLAHGLMLASCKSTGDTTQEDTPQPQKLPQQDPQPQDPPPPIQNDQRTTLDGTWVDLEGEELRLTNGSFEIVANDAVWMRGLYGINGSSITFQITQINGAMFMSQGLQARWYTRDQLQTAIQDNQAWARSGLSINDLFYLFAGNYPGGNTLAVTDSNSGITTIYSRRR